LAWLDQRLAAGTDKRVVSATKDSIFLASFLTSEELAEGGLKL
jgi:hypothetical protein